ncbi:aarF domain-containing protein kinase 1 [Lepeophtheirus salmonis]|uniref:aarF domain-containing protein kinase 1 n=1 Tax=Lepeophtheirus salmonis TaxID=72036 RepID=UPI001AE3F952|nr:aarF domain-containing protein kinase 1-like [Lepeophtheirus salmonis]XP_040567745.1 aarF domain-containing protein kinase 1-like [Lepeophtheirus salmonis]
MRFRVIKTIFGGLGIGVLGYGIYKTVNNDTPLDINNIGAVRFGRAAWTVGRIGLDYKQTLFSGFIDPDSEEYQILKSETHLRSAKRLLKLCCDNGGCFIKVGQHIGALEYLLPSEYVETMKVLHHKAPEMPLNDVFTVLKEDLGCHPHEVFSDFDEKPLGTASLAQVHRATLKDGREVAVKVQHRYVKNHSFVDIYTMNFLVKTVKMVFPQFEFMWLAEEMKKNLPLELSFVQEGMNAEKVENLLNFNWLRVPEINWEHTTDRVLVMEYFSGGHINDVEYMKKKGINMYEVSRKIGKMYADMIFKHGYVHCDPHPGNVLVRKNDSGETEVVLLDHGLYTQLTNQFRLDYADFWTNILNADVEGIRHSADKLGVGELYGLFACMVTGRSWNSIQHGIDKSKKNKG